VTKLVEDLAIRLGQSSASANDSDAVFSDAAVAHGKLRYLQGYTPPMLVHIRHAPLQQTNNKLIVRGETRWMLKKKRLFLIISFQFGVSVRSPT
jgi:hypothetical protein